MRLKLYLRLAKDHFRADGKILWPFILGSAFLVMMEYILLDLSANITSIITRGAETVDLMLRMGTFVIALFSLLFLLYAHGFILKNHLGTLGLYHVLGINRKQLSVFLLLETLIQFLLSIGIGLFGGIVFSKLSEFVLARMTAENADLHFTISFNSIGYTLIIFVVIFALLGIFGWVRLRRSNSLEMLKVNGPERIPKGSLLLAVIGFGLLIGAYVLAVRIANPLEAFIWFFAAVLMVIIATYLIMISGSIFFIRMLGKIKSFYYKPTPFISLASLSLRIKRNGAGLASISILVTMVLVTLSTTLTLYVGQHKMIEYGFARQIRTDFNLKDLTSLEPTNIEYIENQLLDEVHGQDVEVSDLQSYSIAGTSGMLTGNEIQLNPDVDQIYIDYSSLYQFFFLDEKSYENLTGNRIELKENQAAWCSSNGLELQGLLLFEGGMELDPVQPISDEGLYVILQSVTPVIVFVIEDYSILEPIQAFSERADNRLLNLSYYCNFNTNLDDEAQTQLTKTLLDFYTELFRVDTQPLMSIIYGMNVDSRIDQTEQDSSFFGGFLFLGTLLSLVFTVAVLLIIYYKQIVEGYEDRENFEIMQKVGLSKKLIRKSIYSQLVIIFFSPVLLAVINLAFASPMITKINMLFSVFDIGLYVRMAAISVLFTSLLYGLGCLATSRVYYRIISRKERQILLS